MICVDCEGTGRDEYGTCIVCNGDKYNHPTVPRINRKDLKPFLQVIAQRKESDDD